MTKMRQLIILLVAMCVLSYGQVFAQDAAPVKEELAELKEAREHDKKVIRELNSKVSNLEQQVFNLLSGDFDTEAKKILDKQFEAQHKQLIDEASTLKTKVKSLTDDLESKAKSVEKLAGQKQILIQQVRKYKSEYARLTSELKISQSRGNQPELRSRLEGLSKQLELVNDERQQKSKAVEKLSQKNAQLSEDLYANSLQLKKAKERIAQFQRRVGGAKSGDDKEIDKSSEVANLNQKIQQLTDQLEESRKQNESLQANASLSKDKVQDGQPPVVQDESLLEKKIADLESQVQLQERFSQEKASQLSQLQQTNDLLNANLKKKMEQTAAAEKSLEQLKLGRKASSDQLAKAQADFKSISEQMEKMKSKSSEDLNRLRESLQSQINQLTQEKMSVEKELASAKSQAHESEKKIQNDSAALQAKISELEKKRDSQDELLRQKDGKVAEFQKAQANSESKIAELSTENKALQEKVKAAQKSLEEISAENNERHAKLAELDKEILSSRKDAEKISQTNKELEKDLALSNQKWQQLNASVPKSVAEAKKELEQKITLLTSQLTSVQDQLKAKDTQLELAIKQKEYMVKSADQFLQKVSSLDKQVQE